MNSQKSSFSTPRKAFLPAIGKENLCPRKLYRKPNDSKTSKTQPKSFVRREFFGEKTIKEHQTEKKMEILKKDNNEMRIDEDYFNAIEEKIIEKVPDFKGLFGGNNNICEKIRGTMIEWMQDIFGNFENTTDFTFFKSVAILNLFFKKTMRKIYDEDLHLTGIVAIYLASKYEDVLHMSLKSIVTWLGHNKFSRSFSKKDI
jgi:hypothetical protein